jgi:hypothetical protein
LKLENRVQLEHGLSALADAGPGAAAAIPDLLNLFNRWDSTPLEDEISMNGPERLRLQLLRAIGAIDSGLRTAMPELDNVMRGDENATEFKEKLGRGGASLPELIAALDEPEQQGAAISGLHDAGPAAVEAVPKLLKLLSSTYEKWRKDEIEQAIALIDPRTKVRHIDSDQLAEALDAVKTALRESGSDSDKVLMKDLTRRYYGLINFATWYTEDNLRDLSRQIAIASPSAHEIFKSTLVAADPTLVQLIE